MKKFRFLFLILALILVVGMTTGLIVRKQTGGQTVMQHSAQVPAQTTPATTGDDEPAAPEVKVFKIPVLIREDLSDDFTVIENGVEVDPIDVFEYSEPSSEHETKGGESESDSYSETYVRYLVDPTCSSVVYGSKSRAHEAWFHYDGLCIDYSASSVVDFDSNDESSTSGSISLSDWISLFIY